jgi:NAD(P)-dependent dehydrogenase (short-subunit alcohol dehydrogenase family)
MAASEFLHRLFSLEGRGAIVTGAARGNGLAIAEALLGAGAAVLLVDRLSEVLKESVRRFVERGLPAFGFATDVTVAGASLAISEEAERLIGHVEILVNNAGITIGGYALDYPDESWEQTYRVNLRAPFDLIREIARRMKQGGRGGSIINITSLNAEIAFPGNPAYVAFKGGLKQLTKAFALDLGRFGIRVNNLGPGYFKTDMTSASWGDPLRQKERTDRTVLGRWGEPSDLAGAAIFLASDASSYVTGVDLYVDGGWLIKGI